MIVCGLSINFKTDAVRWFFRHFQNKTFVASVCTNHKGKGTFNNIYSAKLYPTFHIRELILLHERVVKEIAPGKLFHFFASRHVCSC